MHPSSTTTIATTHARAGLIGNPSDGYGGAAIAFTFDAFAAEIALARASQPGVSIEWHGEPIFRADSLEHALATRPGQGEHGAARLILAATRMLARRRPEAVRADAAIAISGHSSIPLQAGLAGSSAIVISSLRVLAQDWGIDLNDDELASLALRAETEELGIAAGPMDRIAQVRGGLLFMNFASRVPRVEAMSAELPNDLYVAWDLEAGVPSGRVHGSLRRRFEAGEPRVLSAMSRFRDMAERGREALEQGDEAALSRLFDRNFDLRQEVVGVSERDEALVAVGREHGAGVKLTGSGGAVIGLAARDALPAIRSAHAKAGHGWLQPKISRPARLIDRHEYGSQ